MLAEVLTIVRAKRGLDLQGYRTETLERGIARRLEVTGTEVAAYVERLRMDDTELDALLSSFLIGVTEMFRDADVWEALRDQVLPSLSPTRASLRAWSIGCATGEEAWSLAAVLEEHGVPWEILATDVDLRAIDVARARGVDAPASMRSRVRFAQHDIGGERTAPSDAVVAAFDLVLLRNVLIYFARPLQERVLARVASVLLPGGALVLGAAEEASAPFSSWPGVEERLHIFRRLP